MRRGRWTFGWGGPRRSAAVAALMVALSGPAAAQFQGSSDAGLGPSRSLASPAGDGGLMSTGSGLSSPGTSLLSPNGGIGLGTPGPSGRYAPSVLQPSTAPQGVVIAPGQVGLLVSARFGAAGAAPITGGLHWRVYRDKPDRSGNFRPVKEDVAAAPTFVLPPGGYVVHAGFGLASAVKHVQLRAETVREVFDIPAGGLRLEGRVGDAPIPPAQIHFDIYQGSQFEPGDKKPILTHVTTGAVALLPEGTYYIVSNYGDANAVIRSDIRVQAGKLTDVTVAHHAAIVTLKLVSERGGEALANTAWSVLTPGGDVIKESIGAFPRVILAEGDYRVIARNDGKVFEREFKVSSGVDGEVEVLAR